MRLSRKFLLCCFISLAFVAALGQQSYAQSSEQKISSPFNQVKTQEKSNPIQDKIEGQVEKKVIENNEEPDAVGLLMDPSNILGLKNAEDSINKTFELIKKNKLVEARNIIEPVVDWLEDSTEYHANLYKVLKEISTAKYQANVEKDLALKFAILRDRAYYQLALLYIEEKKFKNAVKMLVNVVRSQPKTQLGFSSYQVLQQIGFTYKLQLPESETESAEQ